MNPYVVEVGDEFYMFYAGADIEATRRICLAIADRSRPDRWRRLGPVLELGAPGTFDEEWMVLPAVHRIGDRWHLYWTGRSAQREVGLQAFYGMGLAVSDDLVHWERYRDDFVLTGDGFADWPGNRGIAGAGSIHTIEDDAGKTRYRMYYTLPTGRPSPDVRIDQAKQSVVAHSYDGIDWFDKRLVLTPRPGNDYEDAATIGLNVWQETDGYHAAYGGIGSRTGGYTLCEARSRDGLVWERGEPGDNIALPLTGLGWDGQMTTYPNIIEEGDALRMFYCGNGYGGTGIGMAVADRLS